NQMHQGDRARASTCYSLRGIRHLPPTATKDPGQFLIALDAHEPSTETSQAIPAKLQFRLMFRTGREWIVKKPQWNCAEGLRKLQKLNSSAPTPFATSSDIGAVNRWS